MPIHSTVIQKSIRKPIDALRAFNETNENGIIPVVLVPKYAMFCDFFVSIPSGMWVLYQKWHAHAGLMEPGLKKIWPAYYRVSHIVTKHSATYCAPVKKCPTSDNVMVDIDISINFQIGPDSDAPRKFVYNLGAHRFDELISQQTEEAIRGLVNSVRHDQVHDLREEFAAGMKTDLNEKMIQFGVIIHNVKVTDVKLPTALSETLQRTTEFSTKMEEQEKSHENKLRDLLNTETKRITEIRKKNERAIQDLLAKKERCLLERQQAVVQKESRVDVDITNARSEAESKLAKAEGKKEVAFSQASAISTKRTNELRVSVDATRIEYSQQVEDAKILKQAAIEAANMEAQGILASAEAEEVSYNYLKSKRMFDYEKKKIESQHQFARSSKIVMGGKTGEQFLKSICEDNNVLTCKS